MKFILSFLILFASYLILGCAGKSEDKESNSIKLKANGTERDNGKSKSASSIIDLNNKGIGPITNLELNPEIDQSLAAYGKSLYNQTCVTCHRSKKRFTGPPLFGIFEKRSPEWVMNMILNPEVMSQRDPIANALFKEYMGSLMINQHLSEGDARAILEYLRILE
jgi:hypothetical protein